MASGMSWLGWHRSNLGLRQRAMNLDNPSVVLSGEQPYFPGESIRGKVSWGFRNNVAVKDTTLSVNGACKVRWTVGFGESKLTFESHEPYFNAVVFNDDNTEESLLNTDDHEVSFDVTLSENIPSSFESKYGNISYSVSLMVSYSDGRFTYKESFDSPFLIINPYRLTGLEAPIALSAAETYGLCGHKDTIKFELATDKSVYDPGESILLSGFVENNSKKRLNLTKLILTQCITYNVTSLQSQRIETKSINDVVAIWTGGEVKGDGKVTYDQQETIVIPEGTPESELKDCEAIHVEYSLKFGVKLPGIFSRELFCDPVVVCIGNSRVKRKKHGPLVPKRSVRVLMKDGSFMRL